LVSGEVDVTVVDALSLGAFIKAGQVRVLASMSPQRNPSVPDVPTVAEAGLPSHQMMSAHVMMVKAGTPPDVVARLGQLVKSAADSKELTEWMPTTGFDSHMVTGADATRELSAEIDRIGTIARDAGLMPS
jgi:tripartite-type tricarboxylate transporter receptor subunit TctC